MFGWLFGKSLHKALAETKKIRVDGVNFEIRKINPLDYLQGSKSVRQMFDTFNVTHAGNLEMSQGQVKSLKDHYSDVFLASVVKPKLKRSESDPGEGIPVGHLMTDWELANGLYERILEFTYGKKKMNSLLRASQKTGA